MMRLKASKDSSRGFQVSSEISFLISIRKALTTLGQTPDLTCKKFFPSGTKRALRTFLSLLMACHANSPPGPWEVTLVPLTDLF
jgi:hypothetical protein